MRNDEYRNIYDIGINDIQPNSIDTDFKAETVAAHLVENGYDPKKITIVRLGTARRGFGKDIEELTTYFSEYDHTDFLQILANREGIYDILPEGIFHQTVNRKLNKDKEEMVDEIKIHREEEFFARKFFRLFEIELDHVLTDIALLELVFDKRISHPDYISIFRSFWPVMDLLDREQAVLFLHAIPLLQRIRNSNSNIEESLSLILGVPIRLTSVILEKKDTDNSFESRLGTSRLGLDLILGNTFNDGQYDLNIRVGPMSALKMKDFLKGARYDRILDGLCRLFLPANVFLEIEYVLDPEDSLFILSTGQTSTWLGINSFLTKGAKEMTE
jgi:hypothetical protein